ncbi:MAG: hypothetical protein ACRDZM_09255 [Acidimicrobiia bacterium]
MPQATSKTVAQKMGIKPASRAHIVNAPAPAAAAIHLPDLDLADTLVGEFDYLHLFVTTQDDMRHGFPKLKEHLRHGGMLWVSWPKGGRHGSDLNIKTVIEIGYDFGLVESICLRIDDTWAGLKFTHPKPGKTYRNSYGTLPDQHT